jgi:hypothetical protein
MTPNDPNEKVESPLVGPGVESSVVQTGEDSGVVLQEVYVQYSGTVKTYFPSN